MRPLFIYNIESRAFISKTNKNGLKFKQPVVSMFLSYDGYFNLFTDHTLFLCIIRKAPLKAATEKTP